MASRVTECGWCDGRCTRANQCPSSSVWTQDQCTPIITKVTTATSSLILLFPPKLLSILQNGLAMWEHLNCACLLTHINYFILLSFQQLFQWKTWTEIKLWNFLLPHTIWLQVQALLTFFPHSSPSKTNLCNLSVEAAICIICLPRVALWRSQSFANSPFYSSFVLFNTPLTLWNLMGSAWVVFILPRYNAATHAVRLSPLKDNSSNNNKLPPLQNTTK